MKLEAKHNFIIAFICFAILTKFAIFDISIIRNEYMFTLIVILCGVGGFNFGVGIGKLLNN